MLDFIVPEIVFTSQGGKATESWRLYTVQWQRVFWYVDLVFLSFFIVEIVIRVYACARDAWPDCGRMSMHRRPPALPQRWGSAAPGLPQRCPDATLALHGRSASPGRCCPRAPPAAVSSICRRLLDACTACHHRTGGLTYLKDALNLIDLIIVLTSFVMLWVTLDYTLVAGDSSGLDTALALLRVFRIVRIFRIVVILNKIKRTRDTAEMLRKKAQYKRQGSPVERVLDILQALKRKSDSGAERDNLAFMMDVIVSGDLYTVTMSSGGDGGGTDSSYSTFLAEGGARAGAKGGKKAGGLLSGISKRAQVKSTEIVASDMGDGDGVPRPLAGSGIGLSGSRFNLIGELMWAEQLLESEAVSKAMADVDSWNFSIFELDKASNKHPMIMLMLHYVKRFDLDSELAIDCNNLVRLLLKVEQGYKEVPFHNYVHGADVTHGTAYFMTRDTVARHMSALDLYCMVLGAAIHDFEHPGYNNAFLVASKNETAILYNDSSVLENYHIASAWRMMLQDDLNPFAGFSPEQYNEARATMVYAILGTDMKFHFDHLTKFKTRLSAGAFDEPDRKDVRLLLAMCMHSADVSNPAKEWNLSSEWACRVMEEFFRQGDREAELGLPVSPFMDRAKTDIGKCQAGFITILIKPFFEEWVSFLGSDNSHIFTNVESNIKTWAEQGAEVALGERAEALKKGPKADMRSSSRTVGFKR